MATNSAQVFGQRIINYGEAIANANKTAVTAAAMVYKGSILASGAKFTGGDLRFSRWKGKQGPRLGAGFEVTGKINASALIQAKPMGIWKVLEFGSPAHVMTPKSKRRAGAKALHMGSGPLFYARVNHPGRKGTNAWTLGSKAGEPGAMQAYKRTQILALAEAN
jgi:hypothetical protein